ncbi:MAG TPA: hypothetical protein VEK37_01250 [Gemmatimonadaceae bacterium]|nr:hypothetical protein [Gemmatimonadaceae bacterium]
MPKGIYQRKGAKSWASTRTTVPAVVRVVLTGFVATVRDAKIAVLAESRLEILSAGRAGRPSQLFVVQLAKGSTLQLTPASLAEPPTAVKGAKGPKRQARLESID